MDYLKIRISLEQSIGKDLYELMEGPILEQIIKKAKIEKIENEWKYILEGHSFKITKELVPDLFKLCSEVIETLNFKEPIDFYVSNAPDLNAFAISRIEEEQTHIININSSLIDKLDNDELKFIIGHEIGHLISHNADISRLIYFVFPDINRIPGILYHKIKLWEKLSELTADRFGFIASPNLNKCISCFFKLASGLDTFRLNLDINAYLVENEKILEYFKSEKATNLMSHPINPIRIKAIQLFSGSDLFKNIDNTITDKTLDEQIQTLTDILLTLSNSELDMYRKHFIAAAGIILSGVDKDTHPKEFEKIIYELSCFDIFPKDFLYNIYESKKVGEIFEASIKRILSINPSDRYFMLTYCISLVMADKKIKQEEVDIIFNIGVSLLGFNEKEVAQIISDSVRKSYIPELYA